MSDELSNIVFGFKLALVGGNDLPSIEPDFDDALERLLEHKTLRVQSVLLWPLASRVALNEMLTSWLLSIEIALYRDDEMPAPDWLLSGSSSTRLSEQIVSEILLRSGDLILQSLRRRQAQPESPN